MADGKSSHSKTDKSKSGKDNGKEDGNIISKTAHSIKDKVHEITDDVKEITDRITHHEDSKKNKDHKKTDTKSKTDTKLDDDEKHTGTASPSSSSKSAGSDSKILGEKKDNDSSKTSTTDSTTKPSGSSPSPKPPGSEGEAAKPSGTLSSSAATQPTDKQADASSGAHISNTPAAETNPNDHVHLSFDGVKTVDDLLERIDQAVENAKIVVDDGKNKDGAGTRKKQNYDLGTKSADEPIRLAFGDIHTIEDILAEINNQPGHRKVVLEGAPHQTNTIPLKKSANPPSAAETGDEKIDCSKAPNPADQFSTSRDQIHVNIENVQNIDEFLDRVDQAVMRVPIVIDKQFQDNKNQESSKSNQNEKPKDADQKELAATMKSQKDIPKNDGDGESQHF